MVCVDTRYVLFLFGYFRKFNLCCWYLVHKLWALLIDNFDNFFVTFFLEILLNVVIL